MRGHSTGCLYLCGGETRGQDGYLQSSAGCTPQSCIPWSFPRSSLPGLEGWVGAAQSQLILIEELRESDKIRKGSFPPGTNGGVVFPLSSACLRRAGRLPLGKPEGRRFLTPWSWEGKPGEPPGEREREVRAGCFGTDWPCLRPDLGPRKRLKQAAVGLSGLGEPSGLGLGCLQRTQFWL